MRHSLAVAIVLASTTLAAPALAGNAATAEADTAGRSSTGAKADLGTVISAIQASRSSATAIQTLTTVGTVNFVKVSEIATGDAKQALDTAVSYNQAAIMANDALKARLEAESIDTSSIVAANIEADGAVTIFVM